MMERRVELHLDKLIVLPMSKTVEVESLAQLEHGFLYSLVGQLSLYSEVQCKNLSGPGRRLSLSPEQTYDDLLKALGKMASSYRARYVLTGSMSVTTEGVHVVDVRMVFRLYDVQENRFVIDTVKLLDRFDADQQELEHLSPDMERFNQRVGETVYELLEVLQPESSEHYKDKLINQPFCRSYVALQHLVAAETHEAIAHKISSLESAIQHDAHLELAYFHLGRLYKMQNEFRKSVYYFRKALTLDGSSPRIKAVYSTEAGIGCALLGEYEPAVQWWKRAIDYAPDYINPYLNLAHALEEEGKLEEAETYFSQAQAIADNDYRTYYSLARVYSKLGQWSSALEQYQKSLVFDEQDPWCYSNIATCYLQLQETEQAREYLEKAVLMDAEGEAGQYAQLILEGLSL